MDAWEDDGDFFHDDDTVVHAMPSASREEASAEASAEAEPEDQIPAQEEQSESEAPEADDSDFATPGDGRIIAAVRKKHPLPRF